MNLRVDFWDVGQGDCSVIHLPDGEGIIIIDTGPPTSMLPRWLADHRALPIHSLILTHLDEDHAGCCSHILERFHPRIRNLLLVDDRERGASQAVDLLLSQAVRFHKKGKIFLSTLEARREPQPLYWFDGGSGAQVILYAVYPNAAATIHNRHGRATAKPNDVSGIICLDVNGKTEVIWAGDAAMQTVSRVCGKRSPLIVVGPHHGGPIKRDQNSFAPSFAQPCPENVFVSVGTKNIHNHPVKKFVQLHRDRERRVCCSELVHCDRRRLEHKDHVLDNHLELGMLPPKEESAVTCRGPMQIRWDARTGAFVFDRFHDVHQMRLTEVAGPYCVI